MTKPLNPGSKPRPLLGLALIACLPASVAWLGYEICLTGPQIVGWQLWLLASVVLLIAVVAMMALVDGPTSDETDF